MTSVIMILMMVFRNQVPYIYTSEPEVAAIVTSLMFYLCLMMFFDFGQGLFSGAIRGIGKQDLGSIMSLISYWIIMLPMCYLFTFTFDFGVIGIWIGVPFGAFSQFSSLGIVLIFTDWKKMSDQAIKRVEQEKKVMDANRESILDENY